MLDLKSMQEAGEETGVPVSDEEMKNVVESMYGELPRVEWAAAQLRWSKEKTKGAGFLSRIHSAPPLS